MTGENTENSVKFFSFIAEELKEESLPEEGDTVCYRGVYRGILPETGAMVELMDIENVRRTVEVLFAADGGEIPGKGQERAAEIRIRKNPRTEPSRFDVLMSPLPMPKSSVDVKSLPLNNRRIESLIWKYQNDQDVETLGAISEYLVFAGKFYLVAGRHPNSRRADFTTLLTDQKQKFYPVFTNLTEAAKKPVPEGSMITRVDFDGLIQILREDPAADGIVINPWSFNLIFNRDDLKKLHKMKQKVVFSSDPDSE